MVLGGKELGAQTEAHSSTDVDDRDQRHRRISSSISIAGSTIVLRWFGYMLIGDTIVETGALLNKPVSGRCIKLMFVRIDQEPAPTTAPPHAVLANLAEKTLPVGSTRTVERWPTPMLFTDDPSVQKTSVETVPKPLGQAGEQTIGLLEEDAGWLDAILALLQFE